MTIEDPSRRRFLIAALNAGGMLVCMGARSSSSAKSSRTGWPYFSIEPDGSVTIGIPRTEIGQGVMTGLAQLIAEELEANWSQIRVVHAPANAALFGREQVTVASQSIYDSWETWRLAAASARTMLEMVAAKRWRVSPAECYSLEGFVHHRPTRRSKSFGALSIEASRAALPKKPILKTKFAVVGRSLQRTDTLAKCTGRAIFGIDVKLANLLIAVVLHPPRYGEAIASIDKAESLSRHGVEAIINIPRRILKVGLRNYDLRAGVAVVARDYWTAYSAAARLKIVWTRTQPTPSNVDIHNALTAALEKQKPLAEVGRPSGTHGPTTQARYTAPFLAHATMEPMNCTAKIEDGKCLVTVSTQAPVDAHAVAVMMSELPAAAVTVEVPFVGGGFGRRTEVDYVAEAVFLAKTTDRPIKVIWPREEDMRQDYFRPAAIMEISGSCQDNKIVRWASKLASGSSTATRRGGDPDHDAIDWTSVLGAHANPYAPTYFTSSFATVELGPPTGYMRGVSNGYTCFGNECFVDELAERAGCDPIAFRLANLSHDARASAVVRCAAKLSNWGQPLHGQRHQGFALLRESRGDGVDDYNLCVATVVEVSVDAGLARVNQITIVGDFGRIINSGLVIAQMQGGAIFGLSTALKGRIDFVDGEPQQTNFHNYRLIRMSEAPPIVVHLMQSAARPGGVGEKGVPGIAPALANALYRATGHRQRGLPLTLG